LLLRLVKFRKVVDTLPKNANGGGDFGKRKLYMV